MVHNIVFDFKDFLKIWTPNYRHT